MLRPTSPQAYTIAIDPGGNYAAVAVFRETVLIHAEKVSVQRTGLLATRGQCLAQGVVACVSPHIGRASGKYVDILCEGQQIRKQGNAKGSQQPQIELALNTGFILGALYAAYPCVNLCYIPPTTWKGTIAKEIKLRQIDMQLTVDEKANMKHNNEHTKDAAGIGLWWLGIVRS